LTNYKNIFEFDIALVHNWEYDLDFILWIESEAKKNGLTVLIVKENNIAEVLKNVENESYHIKFLFDRASDTSPVFIPLQNKILLNGDYVIDTIDRVRWASDKATMHLEFISAGIRTPYTIILPPHRQDEILRLSIAELAVLGRSFIIKPANTTGGGIGVVDGAETLQDIINARKHFRDDKYLLQEKIVPLEKEGRRFWFRIFYSFGHILFTWWDNQTHVYTITKPEEIEDFQLSHLYPVVEKIHQISKLNFFSTEIALNSNSQFVVVDYINEACDMRLQSRYYDGVPDILIGTIIRNLVDFIKTGLDKKNI